jgi:predicted O-methyltransferase YrrM
MRPSFHFAKKLFGRDNEVVVVEVGVCAGHNALATLSEWDMHMIGIEIDYSRVPQILDTLKWYKQFCLIMADSVEAATLFPDGTIDLAYIDDDHDGEGPVRSINAWWPKVRQGGILAGHDYLPSENEEEYVRKAVNDFVREKDLPLMCDEWDWWVVKPYKVQ